MAKRWNYCKSIGHIEVDYGNWLNGKYSIKVIVQTFGIFSVVAPVLNNICKQSILKCLFLYAVRNRLIIKICMCCRSVAGNKFSTGVRTVDVD